MRNITILNLSGCNMRDIGGVIVARAFGANSPCTSLNLAHNLLSSETGRELGDMLKLNDQLEWLELGWNSLYAEKQSIVPLFGGLKTNVRLQYLGLSWNGIMNEPNGVEAMRKALTSNKALETLDLENNRSGRCLRLIRILFNMECITQNDRHDGRVDRWLSTIQVAANVQVGRQSVV